MLSRPGCDPGLKGKPEPGSTLGVPVVGLGFVTGVSVLTVPLSGAVTSSGVPVVGLGFVTGVSVLIVSLSGAVTPGV